MRTKKPKGKRFLVGSPLSTETAHPKDSRLPAPRRREIWKAKDALGIGKHSKPHAVPDEDLIQFLNTPRGLNVLSVREEKVFRNFVNNNKTHEELRAELGVTEIGLHDYIAKLRLNINDVRESIPGVVPKRTPEQIRWLREQSADRAEDQIEKREELKLLTLMQPTSTQLIDKYETDLTEACELLAMEWWDKPAIEIRLAVEEAAALLHKLIDRYFISPLDNQPVHVVRYQDLKDYIIERLKAKIPNHRCAHQALWLHKCDVCDKVGYLPVNLEDPQAVNLLLSKLGFGKWGRVQQALQLPRYDDE